MTRGVFGAFRRARACALPSTLTKTEPLRLNASVAQAYAQTVLTCIDLAKAADIPVLNMHMSSGVYFTLPSERVYLFERYRDRYLASLARFREACTRCAGESGILLCIENTGGFPDFVREGIDFLLESGAFALTWDAGHSHSAGKEDEAFLLARKSRLVHMHLHDARGRKNHLPLGEGEMDIAAILALAQGSVRRIVLETKTAEGLALSAARFADYL